MGKENRLITVTYTKNTRTLTVEYRYGNGALINLSQLPGVESNPIVVELLPTATYEPKVPTIAGYTSPSADPILMGPEDKTVILYYTEEVEEEVVSVTIEWGTLTFNYKMGMWQPESHTYEDPTIEPSKEGYNTITVTNGADSNVPVSVAIRYEYYSGHDELEVHFTSGEYPTSPSISEWTLAVEESKRVYLWLSGRTDLPDSVVNPVPVGLCIVTITSVSTGGG